MPKITFNGTEGIDVSRITLIGGIPMDGRRAAGASGLMPTSIEVEREMSIAASEDFFNAAVASPDTANETTFEYDMDVQDGTAYSVTVEEGTAIAWRLYQGDPDASVIETTTVLARKAEIEAGGGAADLTLAAFK